MTTDIISSPLSPLFLNCIWLQIGWRRLAWHHPQYSSPAQFYPLLIFKKNKSKDCGWVSLSNLYTYRILLCCRWKCITTLARGSWIMLGRGSTLHCLLMVRLDLESPGQLLVMVQIRVCNYWIRSYPGGIQEKSCLTVSHSMLSWNIIKAAKDESCFQWGQGGGGDGTGLEALHFPYIVIVSKTLGKTD